MKKIAVIIPCFNEAATISQVISDFAEALPEAVIVVGDNNSHDDTANIARQAGAIVFSESRQGKGNMLRTLFRAVDADCYLMVDGDATYSAAKPGKCATRCLTRALTWSSGTTCHRITLE